jgi:hypothetical protein
MEAGVVKFDCSKKPRPPSSHKGEFYTQNLHTNKMLCKEKLSSHERLVKRCNGQSNDKELRAYISRLERRQGRQERAVIRAHYEENFVQKHAKFNLR